GNVLVVAAIDRFSDEATTDFQGLGPHLMPLNGEICIATSTDSDAWARLMEDRGLNGDRRTNVLRRDFSSD
ncbi:MAG: hypothetical protein AAF366_16695, partial [Pseudomonadota bacterium]